MIITGQLDRCPELRYTRTGIPVAKLLLLSARLYRGKSGDLEQLPPEKFDVLVWRQLAEQVRDARLKPGARLRIECAWQQSGTTGPALVARDLQILEDATACSSLAV